MSNREPFFDFALAFEEDSDAAMKRVSELMMDERAIRLRVALNSTLREQFTLEQSNGRFKNLTLESDLDATTVAQQINSGNCNIRDVIAVLRDPQLLPSVAAQYRSIVASSVSRDMTQATIESPDDMPFKLQPVLATIRSLTAKLIPGELSWWDPRFQAWNDTLPGLAGFLDEVDDFHWYAPNGIMCTRIGGKSMVSWSLKYSADQVAPTIEPIGSAAQACCNAISIQKHDTTFYVTIDGKELREDWCLFLLNPNGGRSKKELVAVAPAVASRKPPPRMNEPLRDAVALQDEGRLAEAWHCAANLTNERQLSEDDVPDVIDGISKHEYRLKLFVYDVFESMEELVRECRPLIQELLGMRAAAELTTKRLDETKQEILGRIPAPSM